MSNEPKPRRKANEDDVRASGFRCLEGIGRVVNLSASDARVRLGIECNGLAVKLDTMAAGAKTAAKIGILAVGDRVLFRARPLAIDGAAIYVGIVEIGALSATGEDYCILTIEQWKDNLALAGMLQVQFPSSIAMAKPYRLAPRGESGRVFWSTVPDAEGVEAILN